ncbi:MAG: Gfo/Idh/MocA family oxidoreductase, partial [Bacteroidales bacterium]|nr:Gfo/Idh/MocA family oxidoreductase [Bacteroidales bacterium]
MSESRRDFLKKSGAAALFTILPRNVLGAMNTGVQGANSYVAPSDQITKGIIGTGGIGMSRQHFTSDESCRLVAVCDVDKDHLNRALKAGEERFGQKLQPYADWRDLVADPNVDIVHIATPSHWHGIMAVTAAKAGKDIFCEKPMTRTIAEGERVVEEVGRRGRIFRLDTWFRFKDTFYGLGTTVEPLKKLVDSGALGWPLTVRISGATGFAWKFYWTGKENLVPQAVPDVLDYDMWL